MNAGVLLRGLREQLGLTIRDVENASARIAAKYGNEDYAIPLSRLSDIETKAILPNIYKLYSLSVIYRRDFRELLSFYGIDLAQTTTDMTAIEPSRTHRVTNGAAPISLPVPIRLDPAFDLKRTSNLGRLIERWGVVPLAYLQRFCHTDFTYGYVGLEDFTMYPLILPGSFVQVDESRNKVAERMWRSEYERPVYFIETREGHTCCWCTLKGDQLIIQPHPLSPVQPRMLKNEKEAEVIGQVVGIAMRLDEWRAAPGKAPREQPALN